MIQLADYNIKEQIHASASSIIYRGTHTKENYPRILKVMRDKYPNSKEKNIFKREYDITKKLNLEGVINAYALEMDKSRLFMVIEDFGAVSLKQTITSGKPDLITSLSIAIKVSDILGQIHQHNIIHKDINPSNIVWNPSTKQVKIIDFGISTELSRENPEILNPDVIQGTLSYISPEQAGRMNRSMDYRTDIYSLGITFYEMLTGQLPFKAKDAMGLMHAHMAEVPKAPHEIDAEIPKPLSDIVIKLMSKTVEERYQSTIGLKQDLEYCLDQLKSHGSIETFQIARNDISHRFQVPEKLYGREKEIEILLSSFERVAKGEKEIMLVAGYSGIGKTVLVHEVHKPIVKRRGYFLSGKSDQFKRNIPYYSLVQAFQAMVKQILSEPQKQFDQWKKSLLKALGPNGKIIIDVIPEIELIIGKQPDVPVLSPQESQNRFNLVFQNFIQVFAKEEHPLVLFLDDLQWADPPSIKMITLLMRNLNTKYLMIIASFRENEIDEAHPLMIAVKELKKATVAVNTITLTPLDSDHVNKLVSDTLKRGMIATKPLSTICFDKTQGNPFFLNQFLQTLYVEELIELDRQKGIWQWHIDGIQQMKVTDNVIELVVEKIQKLSTETQYVLKLAACIGNTFDLITLSMVNKKTPFQTADILWEALKEGLIIPIDDAYKFIEETDNNSKVSYRFLHDGIQQAAYSMIKEDHRQEVHLKIGRLMLQNIPNNKERDEKIFDIVNQLNRGMALISDPAERNHLARLNLTAGRKAKHSAAYESTLNYLQTGIDLLGKEKWEADYDLSLNLHTEATETAYLNADFQLMNKFAEIGLKHGKTILDKVKIYEIRIFSLNAQNLLMESIWEGLHVLKLLKDPLPENPKIIHILIGLLRTKIILKGKKIETLNQLPDMTDPNKLAVMRIMGSIGTSAYLTNPNLLSLIPFKSIKLSIKYGIAPESTYLFGAYGMILCGVLGDLDAGYNYGQLSLALSERPNAQKIRVRTQMLMEGFIRHWKEHTRKTLPLLLETHQLGLDTGDIEYAVIAIYFYFLYSYYTGKLLKDIIHDLETYDKNIRQYKRKTYSTYISICHQTILCLMGKTETPCLLIGDAYNEEKMLPFHKKANDGSAICIVYLNKVILSYLFEDYSHAVEYAELIYIDLEFITSMFVVPIFHFYDSLSRLALLSEIKKSTIKQYLKKVKSNQKKLKKWAVHAPMNYQHKYDLVEAEIARIKGNDRKAIEYYEKAIKGAKKNNYIQELAVGYELVAKFSMDRNLYDVAEQYMVKAYACYEEWGAAAKLNYMAKKYPEICPTAQHTEKNHSVKCINNQSAIYPCT